MSRKLYQYFMETVFNGQEFKALIVFTEFHGHNFFLCRMCILL